MPQGDRTNYGMMKGLRPITLRLNEPELALLEKYRVVLGLPTRQDALKRLLARCCYECANRGNADARTKAGRPG